MNTSLSPLGSFLQIIDAQRKRDEAALLEECQRQWAQHGSITSRDLLIRIGYTSQENYAAILEAHPASAIHESIDNVRTAFDVLQLSHDAIIAIYGQFHAQILHRAEADLELILVKATREVFTFAFAAEALVHAYRGFKSTAPEHAHAFDQLVAEVFDGQLVAAFIKELRNTFGHARIFKAHPTYTIQTGETRTIATNLQFNKATLLKAHWKTQARRFLQDNEKLDVLEIVTAYFRLAQRLYQEFASRTGLHHSATFKDYLRIKQARTAMSLQMSLGLVLQQVLKKKLDPYPYLPRYLSADELARVRSYEDHSKAQVDYLISLRDPLGLCSESTRNDLYALFGVSP